MNYSNTDLLVLRVNMNTVWTGYRPMKMHPIEHLPAYALGALDPDQARRVAAHLLVCPACREEVEAFRASIGMLPGASLPPAPPHHVKKQLMARIHASKKSHRPTLLRYFSGGTAWHSALAVCSLLLVLVFGVMMVDAQRQLAATETVLQELEREQNNQRVQAIAAFLSDPATISQPMDSVQAGAHGNMYMQVGHTRAVLLVGGLPQPAPGKIYQFWFADAEGQVPSGTFTVDAAGVAQAVFDAPNAVNSYAEVMVTVEPSGGSATPSSQIVLAAKLAA